MITFHGPHLARFLLLFTLCFAFLAEPAPVVAQSHRPAAHRKPAGKVHAKKKSIRSHPARRASRRRHGRHGVNHGGSVGRYIAAARRHPLHVGDVQTGKASWYGARYHGRMTSSGERFDKDALTAAHLSLPFGTMVRVRNLTNDSAVVVRITDRGPFGPGRIVDVSEGAAHLLGLFDAGIARVTVEVLPEGTPEESPAETSEPCFDAEDLPQTAPVALEQTPDTYYFLQTGAYQKLAAAEAAARTLLTEQPGLPVVIADEIVNGQTVYRVLAGRFTDRIEAVLLRNRLQADGLAADVQTIALAEG